MDAKGGVKITEQLISILRKPAFMSEFENGSWFFRQEFQKAIQAAKVFVHTRRQLIQNRAEVRLQQSNALKEPLKRLFHIFQPLDMGDKPVGLYDKEKVFGDLFAPVFESLRFRLMVESIIYFDGVEMASIVFEPFALRQIGRIKPPCPVAVVPAGSAYPDIAFGFAHIRYFNILNNPENHYNLLRPVCK